MGMHMHMHCLNNIVWWSELCPDVFITSVLKIQNHPRFLLHIFKAKAPNYQTPTNSVLILTKENWHQVCTLFNISKWMSPLYLCSPYILMAPCPMLPMYHLHPLMAPCPISQLHPPIAPRPISHLYVLMAPCPSQNEAHRGKHPAGRVLIEFLFLKSSANTLVM